MHNSSSKLPSPLEIGSSFLCLFLMFTQGSLLPESQNPDSMHPLLFWGFLHKGLTNWLHLETWWGELFHVDLREQQLTIPPWVCRVSCDVHWFSREYKRMVNWDNHMWLSLCDTSLGESSRTGLIIPAHSWEEAQTGRSSTWCFWHFCSVEASPERHVWT